MLYVLLLLLLLSWIYVLEVMINCDHRNLIPTYHVIVQ